MSNTRENPEIIIASAGAGKTHNLTEAYIRMVEESHNSGNARPFRNILAVTFTNKATDEMKERILEKLFIKAAEGDKKAETFLKEILHDYSGFNVSTIDRFFQVVMKTFARELGQYGSYNVELDTKEVIAQAVDRMMETLGDEENKPLLDWLVDYSLSVINEGGSWDIRRELANFSELLFKEDFLLQRGKVESLYRRDTDSEGTSTTDSKKIDGFLKMLNVFIKNFESKAKSLAEEIIIEYDRVAVSIPNMKTGDRSPRKGFENITEGKYVNSTGKLYCDSFEDAATWCRSGSSTKDKLMSDQYRANFAPALQIKVEDLKKHFSDNYTAYNTSIIIRKNIYLLGLTADIFREINAYLKENNLILLSRTADILNRIIDESDTPFIYERIGNRIDHILLDEFQDTSKLQWKNFEPLIDNNISEKHDNLIVGDVKQSIYRFRGSDSSLLINLPNRKNVEPKVIKENWRSAETIVEFNSNFFETITKDDLYAKDIYRECRQKMPDITINEANINRYNAGAVKVRLFKVDKEDKKAWEQNALEALTGKNDDVDDLGEIGRLQKEGYRLKDITILIRTNNEGKMVVEKLISKGINVVTEDVLMLGYSRAVLKIVTLLKYVDNPEDQINRLMLKNLFTENENGEINLPEIPDLKGLSLYGSCEAITRTIFDEIPDYEIEFVQAFFDEVNAFMTRMGSDLPAFLEWWEETGQNVKISSSSDQDAVCVMTIHKAKGLGFKAVIIPFFREKTTVKAGLMAPYLWCIPKDKKFRDIGLVPVKYTPKGYTDFDEEFEKEKKDTHIDTLNISYVAMTRAYFEMVIYAPDDTNDANNTNDTNNTNDANSMAHKLIKFLKEESQKNDAGKYIELKDHGNGCYEARANNGQWRYKHALDIAKKNQQGATPKLKVLENGIETKPVKSFPSIPIGDRLEQSFRARDFFEFEKDPLESPRIKGLVLHDILSGINNIDDLDEAVNRSVIQGDLKESERKDAKNFLAKRIESIAERHWFDGTYDTLNEQEILISNGETQRPDRILLGENETIVIDYKFGKHDGAKYRKQVRDYMKNLEQIGLPGVTGYIWYFKDNDIVKVDLNEEKTLF